jgi:hypothetical protein
MPIIQYFLIQHFLFPFIYFLISIRTVLGKLGTQLAKTTNTKVSLLSQHFLFKSKITEHENQSFFPLNLTVFSQK